MTSENIVAVESDANPRFKRWKRLALEPRAVKRERATLLEGLHLLGVVHDDPEAKVEALMISEAANAEARALAEALAQKRGLRLYRLAKRLYDQISPVETASAACASSRSLRRQRPPNGRRTTFFILTACRMQGTWAR